MVSNELDDVIKMHQSIAASVVTFQWFQVVTFTMSMNQPGRQGSQIS